MYKELGFTKTARGPGWLKSIGKAVTGDVAATDKIVGKVKHGREFATNLSQEAMKGAEGILNPFGWRSPNQLAKGRAMYKGGLDAAKAKAKRHPGRTLAVGVGLGVVGSAGVNSVFGHKKRNSPYYPY